MYILGNEILSTDWSKFWIEHLEVWAETQYSIGGKSQVWLLLEAKESSAAAPEAEAGAEKISMELTSYPGSESPLEVSPCDVPQVPISSVTLPL